MGSDSACGLSASPRRRFHTLRWQFLAMRAFTWLVVGHILLIAAHNAAENDSPAQVVSLDEGHSGEAQLPFNLALPWAAAKKPAPPVRPAPPQLKVAANEQMATGQKRAGEKDKHAPEKSASSKNEKLAAEDKHAPEKTAVSKNEKLAAA